MRILIIEAEAALRDGLAGELTGLGHSVVEAADGVGGLSSARPDGIDAVVLGRVLPGADGIAVVRALRDGGNDVPVLILSSIGGTVDRAACMEAGADDHLVVPTDASEAVARVIALVHRARGRDLPDRLSHGDLDLDPDRLVATRAGRRIDLRPREVGILAELMLNLDGTTTRAMLLHRVWGPDFHPATDVVGAHVDRLRSKLSEGAETDAIEALGERGWRLRGA